jgi:thioesterase domain-containing protein
MLVQVEQWFGSKLPHSVLVEHPTIRALAAYLRQGPVGKWPALVTIQTGAFLPPLFIAHGVGGSLLSFIELAAELGREQPVYGLQLPVFLDQHQADLRVLAANCVKQVRAIQPSGPYHLAGHSSGGVIVLEMACQLAEQGETVGLLALLDCDPNAGKTVHGLISKWSSLKVSFRRARAEFAESKSGVREFVEHKTLYQRIKIKNWLAARSHRLGKMRAWLPNALAGPLLGAEGYHLSLAVRDYQPRPYRGNATLFIAQDEPGSGTGPESAWAGTFLGVCETQVVPGTHHTMLVRPQVTSLAREIGQRLARHVQSSASSAVARVPAHEKESFTKLKHINLVSSCAVATAPIVPSDGDKSCSLHG